MKTILTVDDSPSIRQMVAMCLRAAGYHVEEAEDGVAALERVAQARFDLVLSDVNMPRLDGFGLVAALRAQPGWAQVPILMLTTESSDEMKRRGRAVGATGWLVKPFDPERLVALVQRLLG